jgi:hypothetical protein
MRDISRNDGDPSYKSLLVCLGSGVCAPLSSLFLFAALALTLALTRSQQQGRIEIATKTLAGRKWKFSVSFFFFSPTSEDFVNATAIFVFNYKVLPKL